tara:strand:- start:572 stop:751 length:180 start_codon:yes stop_codon:yes gene_type:complete
MKLEFNINPANCVIVIDLSSSRITFALIFLDSLISPGPGAIIISMFFISPLINEIRSLK